MTDEVLLNSGYKEWEVDRLFHPYASKFFQKRIKDEEGTKYFIGVNKYIIDEKESYQYELYTEKRRYVCFQMLDIWYTSTYDNRRNRRRNRKYMEE